MGGGGFWYYRRTQNAMRAQVRNILAEYMPLDDNPTNMNVMTTKMVAPSMSESETAAMI